MKRDRGFPRQGDRLQHLKHVRHCTPEVVKVIVPSGTGTGHLSIKLSARMTRLMCLGPQIRCFSDPKGSSEGAVQNKGLKSKCESMD